MSVELFRYRGAAKDGGTLEYVFQGGEQLLTKRGVCQPQDQKADSKY